MKIYETEISKKKKAHYSLATEHNGILYISGQLSMDPETRQIPEGLKAQTRQALKNLDNVLKLANATRNDILMCRIYTPDIDFWDEIDDEYALFFGDHNVSTFEENKKFGVIDINGKIIIPAQYFMIFIHILYTINVKVY